MKILDKLNLFFQIKQVNILFNFLKIYNFILGTLTENKMIFSKCSIQGTIYGDNNEANSALYGFKYSKNSKNSYNNFS